ncbi:hypothetical protein C8J57DRAFT_1453858 [Mycena rebaudengoi]|nr:hypothetical protein C8J57DRAFT_1453858 [Mycena rebaudengoi]
MLPKQARILLVGASRYVGGTVLYHILSSPDPKLAKSTILVLIHGQERLEKFKKAYGERITYLPFSSLDRRRHVASAEAMVRGLAKRQTATGLPTWMIHTSGCSSIYDQPLTGESHPERKWDDAETGMVYEFEKAEDKRNPYPQRAAEPSVLDVGMELGVNSLSLQSALIYWPGEGLAMTFSLGHGTGCMGIVPHISDLAGLYYLCVRHIFEDRGKSLPTGKRGIVFPCVELVLHTDIAQGCLDVAFRRGALPRPEVPQLKEVGKSALSEVAAATGFNEHLVERYCQGFGTQLALLRGSWGEALLSVGGVDHGIRPCI